MGYLGWPNEALIKSGFLKGQIGLILGRTGWEKERRREVEEEEEKRKKESQAKGMETHLDHESYVIMHEFPCFDGYNVAQI